MRVTSEIEAKVESFFEEQGISVEAWDEDAEGNAKAILDNCPCEELHTTDSTPLPWVYFNPYIKINCLHQSCKEALWEMASALWVHLGKPATENGTQGRYRPIMTPEQQARIAARELLKKQKQAVIKSRESGYIEATYSGSRMPVNFKSISNPYATFIQTLYKPSDILWTGQHDGSGQWAIDEGKCLWATARDLADGKPLHPFISNSTYKNNITNRKTDNTLEKKYIVLEFDGLTNCKPEDEKSVSENLKRSWWLFSYVLKAIKLEHLATIYSGGKSYHYWCKRPSEEQINWLRKCANDLRLTDSISGLDTACLGASQPCRTPSYFREGTDREQKLLWLAGN